MMNQALVRHLFDYNQLTGVFTHRFDHGRAIAGQRVGWTSDEGYWRTKYLGVTYGLAPLAFLYVYGYMPKEVDHWDGNKGNDAIKNLRDASRTQNQANKNCRIGESGTRGVHRSSNSSKWRAVIRRGGQIYFLGNYATIEEASAVYKAAANELYGEFAYQNRPEPLIRRY